MATKENLENLSVPCDDSQNNTLCQFGDYTDRDTSTVPVFWDTDNDSSRDTFVFSKGFNETISSYYVLEGTVNNNNINASFDGNGSRASTSSSSGGSLLSDEFRISLITLYTITTIFAIIGNILVVIVFAHGRRCRTDIRPFLINLAVADLILAIFCMPFSFTFAMIRNWVFSAPMCPIVLFMQHLSVSASVFTNMAIGIDRFLVVTFPLKARLTTRRAKYAIAIIWLCSLSLSSVQLFVSRVKEYPTSVDCDERWSSKSQRMTFTISVLFITYIIPLVILSVTYSIVSVIMWKRTAPGNAHEGRDLKQLKAKRKVIKMLVLIVIMFALCWLPIHTFFLVLDFNPEIGMDTRKSVKRLMTIIFYVVHWLAMSNSCANPIIYGFMNDSFRADLAAHCYIFFPFCRCLKKVANRRYSMTTHFDSAYNKRFSTVRRSPLNSLCQQSPKRYGSKIYIELRRDTSKERSLGSIKSSSPEVPDRYARNNAAPFVPRKARRPQSYLGVDSESSQGLTASSPNLEQNHSLDSRFGNNSVIPKRLSYDLEKHYSNGVNGSSYASDYPRSNQDCDSNGTANSHFPL